MKQGKRLLIATLCGTIFGFVCYALALDAHPELSWPTAVHLITSRVLIGFSIGISTFHLGRWAIHGALLGLACSLPLAFGILVVPDFVEINKTSMFIWSNVLGMIYGVLTELVTTVLFRAPQTPVGKNRLEPAVTA